MSLVELDVLRIVKIATVILATLLAYQAYRAHRRTNSRGLLLLGIGFAIISVGTAIEGILFEFFTYDIITAELIESLIVVLALLFMVYAIHGVRG